MHKSFYLAVAVIVALASCNRKSSVPDASGNFESEEVIVSAEAGGRILQFHVEEGDTLAAGRVVGEIDAENIELQKQQVEESIRSLGEKTADVSPQVRLLESQLSVQESKLANLRHEQKRTENLVREDAATGKQLDDIKFQIEALQKEMQVTRQQINVQRNNYTTQNRSILSEGKPLEKRVEQLDDQIKKASIVNPISGTVLTKYAEQGEITSPGKALYKIANLDTLTLRAYITGTQLSLVKLGQAVTVSVDAGNDTEKTMRGIITFISGKAEFTPKTIQTKEERANLVYAIKIRVPNDGYLKIGMYGEVQLDQSTAK